MTPRILTALGIVGLLFAIIMAWTGKAAAFDPGDPIKAFGFCKTPEAMDALVAHGKADAAPEAYKALMVSGTIECMDLRFAFPGSGFTVDVVLIEAIEEFVLSEGTAMTVWTVAGPEEFGTLYMMLPTAAGLIGQDV